MRREGRWNRAQPSRLQGACPPSGSRSILELRTNFRGGCRPGEEPWRRVVLLRSGHKRGAVRTRKFRGAFWRLGSQSARERQRRRQDCSSKEVPGGWRAPSIVFLSHYDESRGRKSQKAKESE